MKKAFSETKYYVNTALAVLLAFAGGYATSVHLGYVSSFMLLIPVAAACGFVRLNVVVKAAAFAVCGYFINSFYGGDQLRCVSCAVLCAVCAVACHYAAEMITTKKALYAACGVVLIMLTALPHVFVLGSPAGAVKYDAMLRDYAEEKYGGTGYELSTVRYDMSRRCFRVFITPAKNKSVSYEISYRGGRIVDDYAPYVEKEAMYEARIKLVNALRAKYPNDGFDVVSEKILSADIYSAKPEDMVFSVYINAYVDDAEFVRRAKAYIKAARSGGAEFAYIIFYGGRAGSYYRTLTLRYAAEYETANPEFITPIKCQRFFIKLFGVKPVE
ncbi:MAG: hypothetical protein J5760_03225 [Clostridia bacterium]|nr:hypothetical protein [Clostridia bacterium]